MNVSFVTGNEERAFPEGLRAIARAGAGVNNIFMDRCTKNGIVVFNIPGANANSVKELVICGLLLASRDVNDSGSFWFFIHHLSSGCFEKVRGKSIQFISRPV